MKATSFSSSISANLGNSGEAMVEIHKYSWLPHFCTFCELVEGEENKLTTFSTWTIMLGCNESNIIFEQHLCKLGQLRRSKIHKKSIAATLSYFLRASGGGGEQTNCIFHMDYNVRVYNESNIIFQQHLCKLGQLQRSNGVYGRHTFVLFVS